MSLLNTNADDDTDANTTTTQLNYHEYYGQFHGHDVSHLTTIHTVLRRPLTKKVIWLVGDSSLDNKFWIRSAPAKPINGYEKILSKMKMDVCYHINHHLQQLQQATGQPAHAHAHAHEWVCINGAVEASTLSDRACSTLLEPDVFVRDHIEQDDTLVVSIGGNDIALKPLLFTIVNMLTMIHCVPISCMERLACACPPNLHVVDCGCLGCGLSGCLLGWFGGWPPGLGYFVDLFGNQVKNYIMKLIARRKPHRVIVCMIYFPLVKSREWSWADASLGALRYDSSPERLQTAIRVVYRLATQRIRIPGVDVIAMPLFHVLDGIDSRDYVARVEPSEIGGEKMARELVRVILEQ